jgi:hypothetical protein
MPPSGGFLFPKHSKLGVAAMAPPSIAYVYKITKKEILKSLEK